MDKNLNLVVVEPNGTGGLIHYAYQLCTALSDNGANIVLITAKNYELNEYPHNFSVSNILNLWTLFDQRSMEKPPKLKIIRYWRKILWTLRRALRGYRLVREWLRLTKYIKELSPDIIQFGKINFPFETLFLRHLRNQGFLLTQICHEFERRESSRFLATPIDRAYASVFANFSYIFFHATENRNRFFSLFPNFPSNRTHIIPHGNEGIFLSSENPAIKSSVLRERYQIKPDVPVVLFFGLLSPSKGLEDLIDAFLIVRKACDSKLVIAGYPSKFMNMDALLKKIKNSNLTDSVILDARYIPSEEVGPLMRLSTLVVYPYKSSTQSGALQVAYTFGRPVVVSDVGGMPEAVEDGFSGFLVPPQNPEALAEKIILIINNKELAFQMGMNAEFLSKTKFGWGSIAKTIVSTYQKLISDALV